MKRFFALFCICAVLLTLAACAGLETASGASGPAAPGGGGAAAASGGGAGAAGAPSASGLPGSSLEQGSIPPAEPGPDALPLQPLPDNVTWAVEPALEFTCIAPSTLGRGDEAAFYNTCGLITSDGLSEVTIDGKYGLIDHNGQWAAPCEFDSVFCGYGGKYALEKYSGSEGGSERYIYEPGVGLHKVTPDEEGPEGSDPIIAITGTATNPFLCYVPGEDKMYLFGDAMLWSFQERGMAQGPDYPARALLYTGDTSGNIETDYWMPDFNSDIFVLTDGKRPVSDERYQSIGCVAEGIVPARRSGGKWGYLDTAGNVVLPFEYDSASLYYETWDRETYTPLEEGVVLRAGAFQATEGTVVLRKGDSSALYTVTGEEIIPLGIFEDLLPLHEGRMWAKYNGKWGVLALKD